MRLGWGGSLIKTQERVGGTPAALAKNSGSTRRPARTPEHPTYSPLRGMTAITIGRGAPELIPSVVRTHEGSKDLVLAVRAILSVPWNRR